MRDEIDFMSRNHENRLRIEIKILLIWIFNQHWFSCGEESQANGIKKLVSHLLMCRLHRKTDISVKLKNQLQLRLHRRQVSQPEMQGTRRYVSDRNSYLLASSRFRLRNQQCCWLSFAILYRSSSSAKFPEGHYLHLAFKTWQDS